ncbi:hypothetical protein [Clostridium grantii]|uniref:ABC-2 family transporter protein n=1 Tax=Clostridium grantii DSM 8605 TaxID=1121316 RepID=A0A1M5UTR5_9CLOT|nr:hypothetical protein [Clostridium grantii]SHH66379.1 hypothetical protein SAMN02745207_01895 [Clostridium grantii DSM 8605]
MIKKIFEYQRLLLNSLSMNRVENYNPFKFFVGTVIFFIMIYMNIIIFGGNAEPTISFLKPTSLFIILPVVSVWQINMIFYDKERLFELAPVNRKFTVLNVFLFASLLVLTIYVIFIAFGYIVIGIIIGIVYLFFPENVDFNFAEEVIVNQVINTVKADILMFILLLIILFVGTAIVFINDKKIRMLSYLCGSIISYGFLVVLKFKMPILLNTGKVVFMESFSIMPQANIILVISAIIGIILCVSSVVFANKMYT